MPGPTVVAVVVTYKPDRDDLFALLDALAGQVASTAIVDNGSGEDAVAMILGRARAGETLLPLDRNFGIAHAQNRGIEWARKQAADYVILFDQDSVPEPDMVAKLVASAQARRAAGEIVAAIGPTFVDERLGKSSVFSRTRLASDGAAPGSNLVEVDHVIASGCLMPVAALDIVGAMREDLFIDYVDIEWCLRARHHGLRSYGALDARMVHQFGSPMKVFGIPFSAHSPMRNYYLFRNSIWLWRQGWVPLRWKLERGGKLVLRLGFNLVFARPLGAQWRMIGRGLRHGLTGRMGRGHD